MQIKFGWLSRKIGQRAYSSEVDEFEEDGYL